MTFIYITFIHSYFFSTAIFKLERSFVANVNLKKTGGPGQRENWTILSRVGLYFFAWYGLS